MAHFSPEHFSGTVRTTKDDLRFGPLSWRRVNAVPPNTFGRNGDFVVVDDTTETDIAQAINRIPTDVLLCQKMPITITPGDFTVTAASGVYTIDVVTIDDFVEAITRAQIPELRVEVVDDGANFLLHAATVTFADGTSDLPSELSITGLQQGEVIVETGMWVCNVASSSVNVEFGGVPVGSADTLNFAGPGVASVTILGTTATITISGGGGVAYGSVVGDTGTATATVASETITFGGTGINVVATNGAANLDMLSFDLDIADLPAGGGPVVIGDTIAINQGGTTLEYPLSALSSLFGGVGYGSITGGDGGTATATTATELITFNGTGINITSTNAGAGLDTTEFVLDIADLPAGAGPLAPTDELAVNDGGTTERHSLEDVVEAVLPGIDITTINGQPMLTLEDTTRANKILSVSEQVLQYNENALGPGDDWIRIGNASDIDTGYIMDFDGTVVYATAHSEDASSGAKDLRLFINAADNGVILTLPAAANATDEDATLNIDFAQGDRIRIRADAGASNTIGDTVVKLTVKWRG